MKKRFYRQKQQATLSLEDLKVELKAPINTPSEEKFIALKACISQLEFSDRAIIILFLEEMAYKEIAEIIGISENYVVVKIKRIKENLGVCLKHKLS